MRLPPPPELCCSIILAFPDGGNSHRLWASLPTPKCSEFHGENSTGALQGWEQGTAWFLLGCRAGLLCSQGLPLLRDAVRRAWATKHTQCEEDRALERVGWCWCHLPGRSTFPPGGILALAVSCLLPLHKGGHPERRQIKPEPTENLSYYSFPNTPPTPGLWRMTPLEENTLACFTAHKLVTILSTLCLDRERGNHNLDQPIKPRLSQSST